MQTIAASSHDPSVASAQEAYLLAAGLGRERSERTGPLARRSGRALEILGHAIEYLADEYVRDNSPAEAKEGTLQAIQILMEANRDIYHSRPKPLSLREWLRAMLRLK
ncbi:MAG: hypothetical protein WBF42_01470 [Terracidiphilus sp.]